MVGGAAKKRKSAAKKAKKGKKAAGSKKPLSIKDRIKAGAKVRVGDRGGMYIVFDGKKHPVKC